MDYERTAGAQAGGAPASVWMRLRCRTVAGEDATPFQWAAAAADMGSQLGGFLPFRMYRTINADITLHINRLPTTSWIGLDGVHRVAADAIGQTTATDVRRVGSRRAPAVVGPHRPLGGLRHGRGGRDAENRAEVQRDKGDLVFDELDEKLAAFNAFRKSDGAAADAILGELGANDAVDRDIVLQLAGKRPLGHPERFDAAHAMAIRSLEVLDRNGARSVTTKLPGPLNAIGAYLIQLVTRFIVSNHQKSLAQNMRKLYARREANCLPDDPARHQLRRARIHADLVGEGFKKNPLGVPSFLLGGALVSSIIGGVVDGATSATGNKTGWFVIGGDAAGAVDGRQLGHHPGRGRGSTTDRADHGEAVQGALRDHRSLRQPTRRLGEAVRPDRDDHPDRRLGARADRRRHRLVLRRLVANAGGLWSTTGRVSSPSTRGRAARGSWPRPPRSRPCRC